MATPAGCSTKLPFSPLTTCGFFSLCATRTPQRRSFHGRCSRVSFLTLLGVNPIPPTVEVCLSSRFEHQQPPNSPCPTCLSPHQQHEGLITVANHSPQPNGRTRVLQELTEKKSFVSKLLFGAQFPCPQVLTSRATSAATLTGSILLALPNVGGFNIEGPQSVLEALAVLALIITIHECGHFLAAHFQNIHISKFAIGFGPTLLKLQGKKVEYSLRAIPLGGFVGFPDDDPETDFAPDDPDLLKNRPILDRLIVISAGVIANLTFAYFILFEQVLTSGLLQQEIFPGAVIPEVISTSVASKSGIQAGDIVLGVNGEVLPVGEKAVVDLVHIIKASPDKRLSFYISRNREPLEIKVIPDKSTDGSGRIGVQLAPNVRAVKKKAKNLAEATVIASKEYQRLFITVVDGLKQVLLNFSQTADKISGPVAIVAVGAEVARTDIAGLSQFAAIVNINLAVVNILPLPALDGGYVLLILLEALRGGKKLPNNVEQSIMSSGIVLLLAIGVFLMVRDALNLGIGELL